MVWGNVDVSLLWRLGWWVDAGIWRAAQHRSGGVCDYQLRIVEKNEPR